MSQPDASPEPTQPGAPESAPSRLGKTARVLFGLFVIWGSFYLVALAEKISNNHKPPAAKAKPASPAGEREKK